MPSGSLSPKTAASMHNIDFLQRHRCDALPCFSASPVIIFYIAHIAFPPLLPFSFRHNGLLSQTTRNLPRVTTQRCRHLQWAMFRKPQPLQLVQKVRQYTLSLYGSTPPTCIAVLSWLLSFEERETPPPTCTAVRPPFVRQYFWKSTGGWGHRNVSDATRDGHRKRKRSDEVH